VTWRASPWTTSVGRLFDAVAALCGIRDVVTYEGQAAVELEACCDLAEPGAYTLDVRDEGDRLILDPHAMIDGIAQEVARGVEVSRIATRFHVGLAEATVIACTRVAEDHGLEVVALGGGVFQNLTLLERVRAGLESSGLRVLVPRILPPNDGGISYGQAAIAAARTGDARP
jgi:hydrogenase maturation protein HypF